MTSEDVEDGLKTGMFGMVSETAHCYNEAIALAYQEELGAGEGLGRALLQENAPYAEHSILAMGYRLKIPVTVHIAVGTDIIHMHPNANGAALGETSLRDFRILTAAMRTLTNGGVLLNLGSAVVLPEILLKAMAILRNQSAEFTGFTGVNLDMLRQHRAYQQIVHRVQSIGGTGIALTGHHEILIPLLAFAILEAWE